MTSLKLISLSGTLPVQGREPGVGGDPDWALHGRDPVMSESRRQLSEELRRLITNRDFSVFVPVLERVEQLLNLQSGELEAKKRAEAAAAELLAIVKEGQRATQSSGQDPREFVDETARGFGFYQQGLRVNGNLNQAGHDV